MASDPKVETKSKLDVNVRLDPAVSAALVKYRDFIDAAIDGQCETVGDNREAVALIVQVEKPPQGLTEDILNRLVVGPRGTIARLCQAAQDVAESFEPVWPHAAASIAELSGDDDDTERDGGDDKGETPSHAEAQSSRSRESTQSTSDAGEDVPAVAAPEPASATPDANGDAEPGGEAETIDWRRLLANGVHHRDLLDALPPKDELWRAVRLKIRAAMGELAAIRAAVKELRETFGSADVNEFPEVLGFEEAETREAALYETLVEIDEELGVINRAFHWTHLQTLEGETWQRVLTLCELIPNLWTSVPVPIVLHAAVTWLSRTDDPGRIMQVLERERQEARGRKGHHLWPFTSAEEPERQLAAVRARKASGQERNDLVRRVAEPLVGMVRQARGKVSGEEVAMAATTWRFAGWTSTPRASLPRSAWQRSPHAAGKAPGRATA